MPDIPWVYGMSAGDGTPHFPKIEFVVKGSEEVLVYSGNMIIAPRAPVWVLKKVSRQTWLIVQP